MRNKRIGIYLGFPPGGGGAFQYSQMLLDALASLAGSGVEVIAAYSDEAWIESLARYKDQIRVLNLREGIIDDAVRYALRFGFPIGIWRFAAPRIHLMTRQLLAQSCDLWIYPSQDVWAYGVPTNNVGVIHDLMHRFAENFPETSSLGLQRRRDRHYQRICTNCCGVLVDSDVGRSHVERLYRVDRTRVHVLPYIAPRYMESQAGEMDFEYRFTVPEKFIFYPAQFWWHKNHVRLVRALHAIRESLPDLHLVLVGGRKNAYKAVVEEVKRLDLVRRVHIFGYVPEKYMPCFYRRAIALVMPTFFGPTNIPPLEAMAVGCPVAVSRIFAMQEQVGDAGLYFSPDSEREIADAILRLSTDSVLRQRMALEGRNRAATWRQEHFAARLKEIIEHII